MTTNYFEMGFPENKPTNDDEIIMKVFTKNDGNWNRQDIENAISLTRQSERQNMIKIIDEVLKYFDEKRGGMLNRVYVGDYVEELKSQLQSPDADRFNIPKNLGILSGSSAEPSGLQTQECYICHNRNLTGTKLKCPNCGNNSQEIKNNG